MKGKLRQLFVVVVLSLVVMGGFFLNERVVAAQGITVADAIAKVQEARDALDTLDTVVFDKPNDQEKLAKKLDKAINELGNAKYDKALNILEKDIIYTLDGCNLITEPDEDDKILDCVAQGVVYPLVVESINMLGILVYDDENTVMLQETSPGLAQNGNINISGNSIIGGNLDATGGVGINGSAVIDSAGKWIGDPTGLVGPQGPAGEDGAPGINGTNGVDGEDGEDGAPGINGTNGVDGEDGEDGADGADGIDGLDGTTPWTELAGYPSISTTGSIRIADDPTICDDTYEGTIRYNSATATFEGCDGAAWVSLSSSGSGSGSGGAFACGVDQVQDADGNLYNTVLIGTQCWMAENLNVGTLIDSPADQTNNSTIEKYCYKNDPNICATDGGMYQWNEMMQYTTAEGAQGICPTGWHLPTDAEWKTLEMELGMSQADADGYTNRGTDEGTQLKPGGTSGFEAQFAGNRDDYSFTFLNRDWAGIYWTSKGDWSTVAYMRTVYNSQDYPQISRYWMSKGYAHAVRCIKD